jgi:hypothetical protein
MTPFWTPFGPLLGPLFDPLLAIWPPWPPGSSFKGGNGLYLWGTPKGAKRGQKGGPKRGPFWDPFLTPFGPYGPKPLINEDPGGDPPKKGGPKRGQKGVQNRPPRAVCVPPQIAQIWDSIRGLMALDDPFWPKKGPFLGQKPPF